MGFILVDSYFRPDSALPRAFWGGPELLFSERDGNPDLKGWKARLFQRWEDKRSVLQAQHDVRGDNPSPPPSPLPPRGPGPQKPPSQTIKFHPHQGCSLHQSRQPHLHNREGTTRPHRYNRYLTILELHTGATQQPRALGKRSRDPGVPAASSAPAAAMVSPSDQCIPAIPFRSGSLLQIEITQRFSPSLLATKEEEEDSHGNCLEKEDG